MKATNLIAVGTHKFYWRFNMADEITLNPAEMLRQTSTNISSLFLQIADHIEKLEHAVKQLNARVAELEAVDGNNTEAQ